MKPSVAAISIRNLKQNLRRFVSAASAAGTLLSILALITVVWISGCASSSAGSTITTNSTNTAPAITAQPISATVTSGTTATFTSVATGTPTPTVQWLVSTNGGASFTAVAGATSTTLNIITTASQNGNVYEAAFTNSVSSITSTAATLTVNSAPVITENPTNVSASVGNLATFTAAATGQPTPTVQWMVSVNGGTTFSPVVGATSTTFSFTTSAGMSANVYEAVFTNAAGSTTTTTALLTINSAPVITVNPTPLSIADGGSAIFTAAATGIPAPTVQWFVSTNGGASFNAIAGATSTTLSFTVSFAQF
jgi:hypothetical protein